MAYDSTADTLEHISHVRAAIVQAQLDLGERAVLHDRSKLADGNEKRGFDVYRPKLDEFEFGSDEYMQAVQEMQPFLDLHYAANRHHPEHFPNGIAGMNMGDLYEMCCDWHAAIKRRPDSSIEQSMAVCIKRFGIEPQMASVIENTLRWLAEKEETTP